MPDEFFALSPHERSRRGFHNLDLCDFDGRFFIRGVLPLPVIGQRRDFGWGVWAEVSRDAFRRYVELYSDPQQGLEPAFRGRLANSLRGYEETRGLGLSIQLTGETSRPAFTVLDQAHALSLEQREGISPRRVMELMVPFLHPSS